MRLHAFGLTSVVLMALASCGETLPAEAPLVDASSDASAEASDPPDAPLDATEECATVPCNVTLVAEELPSALAASELTTAWVRGPDVRVLVDASVEPKFTTPTALNGFVHVAGNVIYFSETNGLRSCGAGPCDNPAAPIYGVTRTLGPITSDNSDMFVVERVPPYRIASCASSGGCGEKPRWVAMVPTEPRQIVVTSTRVVVGMQNGAIYSVLRSSEFDGGIDASDASVQEVHKTNVLGGIAAEGTTLYFLDADAGKLLRCSITDCAQPSVLADNLETPRALVLDRDELYWTEEGADAVKVCTKHACVPRVLARLSRPSLLAVGDRVYVVSEAERKLYAAPRAK